MSKNTDKQNVSESVETFSKDVGEMTKLPPLAWVRDNIEPAKAAAAAGASTKVDTSSKLEQG